MLRKLLLAAGVLLMALLGCTILLAVGAEVGSVAFAIGIVFAALPVPIYLGIAAWIDRYEPEPRWMVFVTFFWGATAAAFMALVLNTAGELIVGHALGDDAANLYGGSISAPVVEESAKAAVLFWVYRRYRAEFNGVVDGVVYATMVGLGFAATENILYYSRGAFEEGIEGAVAVFVLRGVLSPFAHPLFTAMTGIGLGLAASTRNAAVRRIAPWAGLAAAIGLHSLWNTAAGSGYGPAVYGMLFVPIFLAMIIFVLIARSREGRIVREQLAPYVGSGLLTQGEIDHVANLGARRRAAKQAKRQGGAQARAALRDYQAAATELAFRRHRASRGLIAADTRGRHRDEERHYLETLMSTRSRVRTIAAGAPA